MCTIRDRTVMPNTTRSLCHCGGIKTGGKCERCGTRKEQGRASRHQRGYDSRWDKVSKRSKQELPWCIPCWEAGRVTVERIETHHCVKIIHAAELRLDASNLLNCCSACHHALDSLYEANRREYAVRITTLKNVRDELLGGRYDQH